MRESVNTPHQSNLEIKKVPRWGHDSDGREAMVFDFLPSTLSLSEKEILRDRLGNFLRERFASFDDQKLSKIFSLDEIKEMRSYIVVDDVNRNADGKVDIINLEENTLENFRLNVLHLMIIRGIEEFFSETLESKIEYSLHLGRPVDKGWRERTKDDAALYSNDLQAYLRLWADQIASCLSLLADKLKNFSQMEQQQVASLQEHVRCKAVTLIMKVAANLHFSVANKYVGISKSDPFYFDTVGRPWRVIVNDNEVYSEHKCKTLPPGIATRLGLESAVRITYDDMRELLTVEALNPGRDPIFVQRQNIISGGISIREA